MKHIFPIIGLIMVLILLCESVNGYLTAESRISWSFTVRPLTYSISDAELIPTETGWIVTITFAPVEGPTSITLQLPGNPAAETEDIIP